MPIKRCILGIPVRLKSSRLPNKILADINGEPMLKEYWIDVKKLRMLMEWLYVLKIKRFLIL